MANPPDARPDIEATAAATSLRLRATDLSPGQSRKFRLVCDGEEVEGLDWMENRFFTPDGEYLMCQTHGALYDPETGHCLAGPPVGETLCRLPIRSDGEDLIIECPSDGGRLPGGG